MPSAPRSFSFVHAADLHLDTPFHGIGEAAPHVGAALREASLNAFDAIVSLAIERQSAFAVFAGDIYDGAERGLRAQLRFRDGLGKLANAGIPSFVVHGNHDPVSEGWSAIANRWPDGVTVFDSSEVQVVPVRRDGDVIATVQGISYATSATTENLALRFARPEADALHVGLLHCNVAGVADGYANYSPCTLDQLRSVGLDYFALGHIHQRKILSGRPGGVEPYVVYPGNIQARSPKSSEREPKGALVVHVLDGVVEDVEFVACDQIRFVDIEASIETCLDLGELADTLAEASREQLRDAEGRSIVARAHLTGRGALHTDLARPNALIEFVSALRDRTPKAEPFCWWSEVIDDTLTDLDLAALQDRGDFGSDLITLGKTIGIDADSRRQFANGLLKDAPRSLQRDLEAVLADDAALNTYFEHATIAALDALLADQ